MKPEKLVKAMKANSAGEEIGKVCEFTGEDILEFSKNAALAPEGSTFLNSCF